MSAADGRIAVAACTVALAHAGILGYSGHVSLRRPDGRRFLIQPFEESRAALCPESVLEADLDGNIVVGPQGARPPREIFIHGEILRARPDVGAVLHYHPELATLFTVVEDRPLVALRNHAARWASGVPVHDDPGHVDEPAKGRALALTLAAHHALLIRGHGAVIVAEGIKELFADAVHFEENALALWRAAALGKLRPLGAPELARFAATFDRQAHAAKLWRFYAGRTVAAGAMPAGWAEI